MNSTFKSKDTLFCTQEDIESFLHHEENTIIASYSRIHPKLQVKDIIGTGGMGTVYLADQELPPREVAIKRLKNPSTTHRWLLMQEAMITGMLEHPCIIPIYQINISAHNDIEIVMKRIQGRTFSEYIHLDEDCQLVRCLEILIQVCNAIEYAHSKDVYHRDIKPENIMLGAFGEVYLLDWGISVYKKEEQIAFPKGIVGTPAYMAPEMLLGDPYLVDAQTDIYLLGAVLHEILCKEPRHAISDVQTIAEQHNNIEDFEAIKEHISTSKSYVFPANTPDNLADLANRSCARDKADRIASVEEFREHLQSYLDQRELYQLYNTGLEHFALFSALIQKASSSRNRMMVYQHFHRARFAFEQVLNTDNQELKATHNLRKLIDNMCLFLLREEKLTAANFLIESTKLASKEVQEKLLARMAALDSEIQEDKRLAKIGRSFDPINSLHSRLILGIAIVLCLVILSYGLSQYEVMSPSSIKTEDLFRESLIMLIPFSLIVVWKRSTLWTNLHGRRATVGVVGGVLCMMLHRWTAMTYNLPSTPVIFTDTFIISLGFANATPTIPSGLHIAIFCVFIGIITLLNPSYFWWTSLLMIIFIGGSIALDAYRSKKNKIHPT